MFAQLGRVMSSVVRRSFCQCAAAWHVACVRRSPCPRVRVPPCPRIPVPTCPRVPLSRSRTSEAGAWPVVSNSIKINLSIYLTDNLAKLELRGL